MSRATHIKALNAIHQSIYDHINTISSNQQLNNSLAPNEAKLLIDYGEYLNKTLPPEDQPEAVDQLTPEELAKAERKAIIDILARMSDKQRSLLHRMVFYHRHRKPKDVARVEEEFTALPKFEIQEPIPDEDPTDEPE
jgi:hypothetical protein